MKACMTTLVVSLAAGAWAGDLPSAFEHLRAELGDSADLSQIESAYTDLTNRLAVAELDAALARTRMASHTGAMLRRELKKVSASSRLVEITRKTGRSEEIARYERRHDMLLEAINKIAAEYQLMIEDLCGMRAELVERGFAAYETRLVELEVADAIQVNQLVKAHYAACCGENGISLDQWKTELEAL